MERFRSSIWALSAVLFVVVVMLVITWGCAKKEADVYRIGAILPLTGPIGSLGEWMRNGHQLAAEDVNVKGGVNGRKIEMIFEDSMDDPKIAVSAFRKLVDIEKVKILITVRSPIGLALLPLADENEVILFADVAHPEISGKSKFVFRHSNTADQEAKLIADFLRSNDAKPVIVALLNDDYGIAFDKSFGRYAENSEIKVIETVFFEKTETDFKSIAQKILIAKPASVVVGGSGKGLGIIPKRLREYGYTNLIISTLFFMLPDIQKAAGEAALGVYHTDFDIDFASPEVADLNRRYNQKFGKDISIISLLEYNDIYLLASVLDEAGYNPERISEALLNLRTFKAIGETMTILPNGDIIPSMKITKVEKLMK